MNGETRMACLELGHAGPRLGHRAGKKGPPLPGTPFTHRPTPPSVPGLTSGGSRPGTVERPMSGQLWPLTPPSGLRQWRRQAPRRSDRVRDARGSGVPRGAGALGRGVEG